MEDSLHSLIALTLVSGLGPVNTRNLLSYLGSASEIWRAPSSKLMRVPGIGERTAKLFVDKKPLQRAEEEMRFCEKHQIEILSYTDEKYPRQMKFVYDAPCILYKKGTYDLNEKPCIAIVGTRKPTEYGREIAADFAAYFAEKGINVVSGLAYGIDIAAHKAALKVEGTTTAVLGHGLHLIYPGHHREKAAEIAQTGALLTEFVSGTKPDANNFPARNRIVSGMSQAILVVEATASGGALITAKMGFEQNREIYAIPGDLQRSTSIGCNQLIRQQIAKLATSPQEILDDLGLLAPAKIATPTLELQQPLSADETLLVNYLQAGEIHVDVLAGKTGIAMAQLNSLLLTMEFKGILKPLPGKLFRLA